MTIYIPHIDPGFPEKNALPVRTIPGNKNGENIGWYPLDNAIVVPIFAVTWSSSCCPDWFQNSSY